MRHHQKLNGDQGQKQHEAHHIIAAHHKLPEGLDHLARRAGSLLPVQQNAAARGDVQRQAEQREQQKQCGKHRKLDGAANLHRGKEDDHRSRHRKRQQKVQYRRRHRHQHHEDHADGGQRQHVIAQPVPDRSVRRQAFPAASAVVLIASLPRRIGGPLPAATPSDPRAAHGLRACCRFAGAALPDLCFHALPVEIGQNRGHGRIELRRNGLADLDRAIERSRQRRILDNRHARPARLGLDLFGQQVAALGHHLGRFHGHEIEAQRDRIMRGIGQHHGRLRHIRLHAPAAHLPLQIANAAANLRTALGLLELVAQILAAHLQPRFPALPLHQVVNRRPAEEQPRRGQQQSVHVLAQHLQARG